MTKTIKLLTVAILISISFLAVNAQESTIALTNEVPTAKVEKKEAPKKQSSSDEINKWEIYGGYSWLKPTQTTFGFSKDDSANGYEVSVTRNFHRFIGVKFATSGNFKTTKEVFLSTATEVQNNSFYTYAGGIQFKDNRKSSRVKPFGHVLVGGIHFKYKSTTTLGTIVNSQTESFNKFLMVFGGGVDVRVSKKISVRPVQFDYLLTNGNVFEGISKGFIRLGAGVNFNF